MKNSKKYSPKVMKLFNSLKKKSAKSPMPQYGDPIEAVVYGLVSESIPEETSGRLYRRMLKHFVDLNDLRVSRKEEILDVLGDSSANFEDAAKAITKTLNTIFEKTNNISLQGLIHDGKRQAHKDLAEIEGITPFAVSYCFLTAMGGHAIPLNAQMLEYLRNNDLVAPNATDAEIAGFLERQIGAADAYNFYLLLRHEAEHGQSVSKIKKTASLKNTVEKAKKVTKKKATVKKEVAAKKKKTVKKKTTTKKKTAKK